MRKEIYILLLMLLVFSQACAQNEDVRIDEIEKRLTDLHRGGRLSGNILIAEGRATIYEESYGYDSSSEKTPLDPKSLFNIASVSKVFTAVAIMQLIEKDAFSLEDELSLFFDEASYDGIMIKNLLTHTSGLARIQSAPFRKEIEGLNLSNEDIIAKFFETRPPLKFSPGTSYFYSNTNYLLLALIVEKASGLSFQEYVRSMIFLKAGMGDSYYGLVNVPLEVRNKIVRQQLRKGWLSTDFVDASTHPAYVSDSLTFSSTYGASSIYTTARDLLKFHRNLENGTLLNKEFSIKMYDPLIDYTVDAASNYPSRRGLSWCVARDAPEIVYHAGGLLGSRSFFMRNREEERVVIMLTNNAELGRYDFSFPMKALSAEVYELNPVSLPRAFCQMYIKEGISSAIKFYDSNKERKGFSPFVAFDFEEIGAELRTVNDYSAMMETYRIYTEEFSDEYSWHLLGEAHLLLGHTAEAEKCLRKALEYNPEYAPALELKATLEK